MKRIQSAKNGSRLDSMRTQHKHFSAYIESLSPVSNARTTISVQPETDVLIRLKQFRDSSRASSARNPFSSALSNTHTGLLKKGILHSSTDYKASHTRPNSSPTKHVSILQTARSIEALPPKDPNFPTAVQDESNRRLFRGSRLEIGPRPETLTNPLFKFADIVSTDNASDVEKQQFSKEREKHEKFTRTIRVLKGLTFDLDLNYDIAHVGDTEEMSEMSQLGGYYRLQEQMEEALNTSLEHLLGESRSVFTDRLTDYSKTMRSLLRGMKKKSLEDECLMLELVWKLVVKLFDSAMAIHDHTINDAVEMTKYRVRVEVDQRRKDADDLKLKWKKEESKLLEQIRKLEDNVTFLQGERSKLEVELYERQEELAKLTDLTSRENVVVEMQLLYRKMSSYLNESELEQNRQVAALEGVEVIMEAARRMQQRPTMKSQSVETE